MRLGIRAVLLIGTDPRNLPRQALPATICTAEYAPYSALFSRAAMVVHQGGVGTTAQCLRAGKPMLIMPYSHDQPDNARRMRRLKVSRTIQRANYRPAQVVRKLKAMLANPKLGEQAERVAHRLENESGVRSACNALEELHRKTRKAG
jgi:UDP:flavonoid glycosyltransferase YjiC (YdhE family)